MLERTRRFIRYRILHADDTPDRIALGVALGMLVAWTPLIGFHIMLALVITTIFKANKFLAVACVWISNPFTIIPVYYPNYLLGRFVLSLIHSRPKLSPEQMADLFQNFISISSLILNIATVKFWQQLADFLLRIGLELFIGGFIIGGFLAIISYFATYHFIIWYRLKHPHKRLRLK